MTKGDESLAELLLFWRFRGKVAVGNSQGGRGLKLREAKALFDKLRKSPERVVVTGHALYDHPERRFTRAEVIALVMSRGRLIDNKMPSAIAGSFMWLCKDDIEMSCELVVKFEALNDNPNELVLVVSAYRKV